MQVFWKLIFIYTRLSESKDEERPTTISQAAWREVGSGQLGQPLRKIARYFLLHLQTQMLYLSQSAPVCIPNRYEGLWLSVTNQSVVKASLVSSWRSCKQPPHARAISWWQTSISNKNEQWQLLPTWRTLVDTLGKGQRKQQIPFQVGEWGPMLV